MLVICLFYYDIDEQYFCSKCVVGAQTSDGKISRLCIIALKYDTSIIFWTQDFYMMPATLKYLPTLQSVF